MARRIIVAMSGASGAILAAKTVDALIDQGVNVSIIPSGPFRMVWQQEMEESFGALVSQLPSDTEVPGLLEDITNKGLLNGLQISSIDLKKEQAEEFYIELPIEIKATGSYHDLGAFVSGMAGLPRIVTLHNFEIVANKKNTNELDMRILAKTYRYRDEGA